MPEICFKKNTGGDRMGSGWWSQNYGYMVGVGVSLYYYSVDCYDMFEILPNLRV